MMQILNYAHKYLLYMSLISRTTLYSIIVQTGDQLQYFTNQLEGKIREAKQKKLWIYLYNKTLLEQYCVPGDPYE